MFTPITLRPVYRAWMKLAMVINVVVTGVRLGIVYYLICVSDGNGDEALGERPHGTSMDGSLAKLSEALSIFERK